MRGKCEMIGKGWTRQRRVTRVALDRWRSSNASKKDPWTNFWKRWPVTPSVTTRHHLSPSVTICHHLSPHFANADLCSPIAPIAPIDCARPKSWRPNSSLCRCFRQACGSIMRFLCSQHFNTRTVSNLKLGSSAARKMSALYPDQWTNNRESCKFSQLLHLWVPVPSIPDSSGLPAVLFIKNVSTFPHFMTFLIQSTFDVFDFWVSGWESSLNVDAQLLASWQNRLTWTLERVDS